MKIEIYGQWNDTHEHFERICSVDARANPHHKQHQEWIRSCDKSSDDDIFYYFEPDQPIIGNHGDFTVHNFQILEEA